MMQMRTLQLYQLIADTNAQYSDSNSTLGAPFGDLYKVILGAQFPIFWVRAQLWDSFHKTLYL